MIVAWTLIGLTGVVVVLAAFGWLIRQDALGLGPAMNAVREDAAHALNAYTDSPIEGALLVIDEFSSHLEQRGLRICRPTFDRRVTEFAWRHWDATRSLGVLLCAVGGLGFLSSTKGNNPYVDSILCGLISIWILSAFLVSWNSILIIQSAGLDAARAAPQRLLEVLRPPKDNGK